MLDETETIFQDKRTVKQKKSTDEVSSRQLYEETGRLKMENDWLKKKLPTTIEDKRRLIEPAYTQMSVSEQCVLLGIPRSTFYCKHRL